MDDATRTEAPKDVFKENENTPYSRQGSRFQFTGSLLDTSFYVGRAADQQLYELLSSGAYCDVLAPRQVGKSSLRMQVSRQLEADGARCASVDLTSIGTASTPEEWYFALTDTIAVRLGLPDPIDFWENQRHDPAVRRFTNYLREVVLQTIPTQVVLLFDEIEAVRLVTFPMDDFFAGIRSLFEARAEEPACNRLVFCLVGVTYPSDLVRNKVITPFNISNQVRLEDFSRQEIGVLRSGLEPLGADTDRLLDEIHAWTSGHPYMTMRICAALADAGILARGGERNAVEAVVHREFLHHPLEDPNLNYAARRFDSPRDDVSMVDKIDLYRRLLVGERVPSLAEHAVQLELYLAGMVKQVSAGSGKVLALRNRIFGHVFDRRWLSSKERRQFLSAAVWQWLEAGKKDDSVLLRGEVLDRARNWARTAVLSQDEEEFIKASLRAEGERVLAEADRQHAQARQRRKYSLALLVVSVASFLIALGFSSLYLKNEVNKAETEVQHHRSLTEKAKREEKTARTELLKAQADLKAVRASLATAEEKLAQAELKLATARAAIAEAKKREQEAILAQNELKMARYALEQLNLTTDAKLEQARSELLSTRLERDRFLKETKRMESELGSLRSKNEKLRSDGENLTNANKTLISRNRKLEAERDKANRELQDIRAKNAELLALRDRLKKDVDMLYRRAAAIKGLDSPALRSSAAMAQALQERDLLNMDKARLEAELASQKRKLEQVQARCPANPPSTDKNDRSRASHPLQAMPGN